ncbi:MAG: sugar 3,4-ketoisomerase [Saprospiraceae bacterium]
MTQYPPVHRIEFATRGEPATGYLALTTGALEPPFPIKRVFWTYFTPQDVIRGRHAHHQTEMVLIALHGRIHLKTETLDGEFGEFLLDSPNEGIYLPPLTWHTMQYSHDAVQLVLASTDYDPADYIRDYETFKKTGKY